MAAGIVEMVSGKMSFAKKIPMLMKATSDNESPTPGYLYQEINKITMDSMSNCHLLLDFLNGRLKKPSPHVKYKALKIMTYLSANGQSEFRSALRHQDQQIRDATNFRGSMDPLQGDALNKKVRKAATELIELLFNIENPDSALQSFIMAGPSGQKMEGFGNASRITTPKSASLLDTVKGLSSHISSFGGYSKTDNKEDLMECSTGVDGEQYVSFGETFSSDTSAVPSKVQFINYSDNTWTHHKTNSETKSEEKTSIPSFDGVGHNDVEGHNDAGCDDGDDSNDDDDDVDEGHRHNMTVENQLVNKLTEEGGIRSVPSKESLEQFTQRCSTLDLIKILKLLNIRMEEPSVDVQMKCLFALEHLLRSTIPNVAAKVLECVNLQQLVDSESSKLRSKANKVFYIAKSQKGALETTEGIKKRQLKMPALSPSPTNVQLPTDDKLVSNVDLLGIESQDHLTVPPKNNDIFHGLHIHERHPGNQSNQSHAKPNQSLVDNELSDLDLLGISGDESLTMESSSSDNSKSLEAFDPLDIDYICSKDEGSVKGSSSVDSILGLNDVTLGAPPSLLIQDPSLSSLSSSSSSSSKKLNPQFTTSTLHIAPGVQPKNSDFDGLSTLPKSWDSFNIDNKKSTGQYGGQSSVTSFDDPFGLEERNVSCVSGLTGQTGQSSLNTSQCGSGAQSSGQLSFIAQTSASGKSGSYSAQTGLSGQSSFTGQSGFVGRSGFHGNTAVASTNSFSMSSTIPLKLSKPPDQKTDFDFLSKSKRESAFSFVQDEMKASKSK